jgi:hypothetical protein
MLRPLRAAIAEWSPPARPPGDPLAAISTAWTGIVGDGVAEHARPAQVVRDTLVVVTRSSAWSQQLGLLSPQILAGLRPLEAAAGISRLRFRVGAVRKAQRVRPAAAPPARRRRAEAFAGPDPAATPADALRTLRERLVRRRPVDGACDECGAPHPGGGFCAPCAGGRGYERSLAVQRLMYEAPWLGYGETSRLAGDVGRDEYERARRTLLARWWEILQKARWSKRVSPIERLVASSYVLLQSRLEPDRISPAIVRNLLGDELAALLFEPHG